MKTLTRYLVTNILALTAIVGLALVSIYAFLTFVGDIEETGQGAFGVLQLSLYIALLVPTGLYTLLPIIAMLGTLLGLGTLASQNELTAMRASGVSLRRIGGATLIAGALLGVLSLLLGDWIAPRGNEVAQAFKTQKRYGVEAGLGGAPIWLRDGDSIFHIRRLLAEDHIADVQIYQLASDLSLHAALEVEDGRWRDGHWQFTGVRRTEFGPEAANASAWASMEWSGSLSPELLRLFVLKARSLSMQGLWRLINYLEDNGLDATTYRLQLWRKLTAPLTIMAMMIFVIPFVLGPLRSSGTGQRLLIGVLIGLGFYVVNEVTASLGQLYSWPAFLAAALPTVVLGAAAVYRLGTVR